MDINDLFEEAVLNWRSNKGIGTAFIPNMLNDKVLVYQILARTYARSPTTTSIIIVNDFNERNEIIEFLIKKLLMIKQWILMIYLKRLYLIGEVIKE